MNKVPGSLGSWVRLTGVALFLFLLSTSSAMAGRYQEASERHERDCKNWCAERADCGRCFPLLPCPPGLRKLKSWRGYGKNWHACSKPGARREASDEHKQQCESWCAGQENCGRCLPLLPCPPGTRNLKSWRGFGKNWHACSKPVSRRDASREHRQHCESWCRGNPNCKQCSPLPCPPPSRNLKKWTGFGQNWFACETIRNPVTASRKNREECQQWCSAEPSCIKCQPASLCPPGLNKLRSYRGQGKNWYACGNKPQWLKGSRAQRRSCQNWCVLNAQCEKCISRLPCPKGTVVYKRFTGTGQNFFACGRPAAAQTPPRSQGQYREESQRLPGRPAVRFSN